MNVEERLCALPSGGPVCPPLRKFGSLTPDSALSLYVEAASQYPTAEYKRCGCWPLWLPIHGVVA